MKHGDNITINITTDGRVTQKVTGIVLIADTGVVRMNGRIDGGQMHDFFVSNSVEAIERASNFYITINTENNMRVFVQELEFL